MTIAETQVSMAPGTPVREAAHCSTEPYSLADMRSIGCRALVQALTTSDQVPSKCPFPQALLDKSADLGLPLVPVLTVKGFGVKRLVELSGNFRTVRDLKPFVSHSSIQSIECEGCYGREETSCEWLLMSTGFVPGTENNDLAAKVEALTRFVRRLSGISSFIDHHRAERDAKEFDDFQRKIGFGCVARACGLMDLSITRYLASLPQYCWLDMLHENRHKKPLLPIGNKVWIRAKADSVSGRVMAAGNVPGVDGLFVGRVNPFAAEVGSGVLFALSTRS
jgi:hypothetical protein